MKYADYQKMIQKEAELKVTKPEVRAHMYNTSDGLIGLEHNLPHDPELQKRFKALGAAYKEFHAYLTKHYAWD